MTIERINWHFPGRERGGVVQDDETAPEILSSLGLKGRHRESQATKGLACHVEFECFW